MWDVLFILSPVSSGSLKFAALHFSYISGQGYCLPAVPDKDNAFCIS